SWKSEETRSENFQAGRLDALASLVLFQKYLATAFILQEQEQIFCAKDGLLRVRSKHGQSRRGVEAESERSIGERGHRADGAEERWAGLWRGESVRQEQKTEETEPGHSNIRSGSGPESLNHQHGAGIGMEGSALPLVNCNTRQETTNEATDKKAYEAADEASNGEHKAPDEAAHPRPH
ncbi:hypothetical protein THAOC_07414, partial [Thalassiosira oceanica]